VSVRLYVEGGGNNNKALQILCRRGFSKLLSKAGLEDRMPRVIACGGRKQAYDDFRAACEHSREARTPVLLVDSEEPVSESRPWKHVKSRTGDQWAKPRSATDEHLHFMVQTMEAWFHGDLQEVSRYYGQGFRRSALRVRADVESISKKDLFEGLRAATVATSKGEYSKGDHSFQILERIRPEKVRSASPWANRFFDTLDRLCR
jgi:hypothetical protein